MECQLPASANIRRRSHRDRIESHASRHLWSVQLTWEGTAPFYEISRDGTLIETGHDGFQFIDATASPDKSYAYTVKVSGTDASTSVTFQTKSIGLGPVPPKPNVSLLTLKPVSATTGWGRVGTGKSAAGAPLRLGKDTFTDGIGLHAQARAVYECKPDYRRFVAVVGIDESKRGENQSSLICQVLVDDKLLAQTPVMKFGSVERWHFDVVLPVSAKRVVIVVDDAGDDNKSDHADWINAGFITE